MTNKKKITIVCRECGSDNVMRDAWAVWSVDAQEWELGTVFDQGFCDDCGGEASLDEKPASIAPKREQQPRVDRA